LAKYSNQSQSSVYYSDDPDGYHQAPKKKKSPGLAAFLLLLVGGTYFVQTTLAANVSLSSGAPIEFGQGILTTVACSGSQALTVTPKSSFSNVTGGGSYFLKSVTVSNIPTSCQSEDFVLKAYASSGDSPLVLFNTSSNVEVYNNAGTYELISGIAVASITSGAESFTATFLSPFAPSASVFRVSIESKDHDVSIPTFCATLNGTLVSVTCTVNSGTQVIASSLTIPNGYTLRIVGASTTITNNGTLIINGIIDSNGILNNNGTLINDGLIYTNSPTGTLNNNVGGTIHNGGQILSNHELNNRSIFNNNNTAGDGYYLGTLGRIYNFKPCQFNGLAPSGFGIMNQSCT
jgi:hypothetical protein